MSRCPFCDKCISLSHIEELKEKGSIYCRFCGRGITRNMLNIRVRILDPIDIILWILWLTFVIPSLYRLVK